MNNFLTQKSLLELFGIEELQKQGKIKMIRHQDSRIENFSTLASNRRLLEEYQSYQKKDIYNDCKYILSYMAFGKTNAIFYGLYEIKASKEITNKPVSQELHEMGHEKLVTGFEYEIEKLNNFSELENRMVIDWGKSTISWHQWYDRHDKTIKEIRPKGYVREFPGYLDLLVSYDELSKIINNQEANHTWYNKLSSVYAIYLILDTKTGKQYIGSASGRDGLWGRWKNYVDTIHGGNKSLIELIEKEGIEYKYKLQYSVLHVLSASKGSEVEYYESLYKKKLGSRAFGLNEN